MLFCRGALAERGAELVDEFVGSALMGTGQFCTNPGLVLLMAGADTDAFVQGVKTKYGAAASGTLLSSGVRSSLSKAIDVLTKAGAKLEVGGTPIEGRCSVSNTLLTATASQFLKDPHVFQTEAFGNATLMVVAASQDEIIRVLQALEGNLTGCVYSAKNGSDDAVYAAIAPDLTAKVGRLLNDKMPTGVAVSSAMNHGGPYPATGHPGFTAVGIPASLIRFGKLTCYDNVRANRLPKLLQDASPGPNTYRMIDGGVEEQLIFCHFIFCQISDKKIERQKIDT